MAARALLPKIAPHIRVLHARSIAGLPVAISLRSSLIDWGLFARTAPKVLTIQIYYYALPTAEPIVLAHDLQFAMTCGGAISPQTSP